MDVFEALADPTRRALLRQLAPGPARVVDLAAAHPVSRPAISRHLRILRDAGLVGAAELGRERHYALRAGPLDEVRGLLHELSTRRLPVAPHQLDALATEVRRTSRDRRAPLATRNRPTAQEDIA